ncbi:NAD(P)H-dependent oxidoreductase [Alicyclobacillus dauci]|uniref:NAD(P)H-dependent oxidoreductase n=1 Tax=Alicyclobacillus dauci TaxID=1475485 RepID=A0ABY6Z924_9BACL|nr:NAD(P)H-dependent oxidoreductase [Alicyclobacillus dauci]WAH39346.1 NAD(P)H-dependent oxidoreductase [Alicyclobacillus dauci]
MNVLIIYAHPNPNSFNAAVLAQVERALRESRHDFTVIDLYKDNFNPVLVYNDDRFRRDLKDDPETTAYRELIRAADHLILIYPVWWYGTPAILKGFFDRVFASGFAFTYDGMIPKGLLKGKSAWVFYTIDSPRWYAAIFRLSADWIVVRDATLKFCGVKPVKRFMFANVKRSCTGRREKWLDTVYEKVRYGLTQKVEVEHEEM